MKSVEEKIEVMQAYARGEQLEVRFSDTPEKNVVDRTEWAGLEEGRGPTWKPFFNWFNYDYRIKSVGRAADVVCLQAAAKKISDYVESLTQGETQ